MKRTIITQFSFLLVILFAIALLCPSTSSNLFAVSFSTDKELSLQDEKIYSTTTINDDFADNSVSVVLTKQASKNLKTYTTVDFPELRLEAVKHVGLSAEKNIREQLAMQNSRLAMGKRDTSRDINLNSFRQGLRLTLQEPGKENVIKAIKLLEKRTDIHAVSANLYEKTHNNPVESNYGHNALITQNLALETISAPSAWAITTGSSYVTIGVLDTGIQSNHPDIQGLIHPDTNLHKSFVLNPSTISGPLVDPHGHGTHVAGIIGATNNGKTGVCWNIRLVSLQVLDYTNTFEYEDIEDAIDYAYANGIQILNASFGGLTRHAGMERAIRNFTGSGGLLIAGAGNRNENMEAANSAYVYPAVFTHYTYGMPNVISVGASTLSGSIERRAVHPDSGWGSSLGSNWGIHTVDVFAPGTTVLSTVPYDYDSTGYASVSGTSMAAPFVTGVAALLKSAYPSIEAATIKRAISDGVDHLPNLQGLCVTSGRLNAFKALQKTWKQPVWSANSNDHGIITASGNISGRLPYGAFDDFIGYAPAPGYPAGQWTCNFTSGWVQLKLKYYVSVSRIYFYQRESSDGNRTKNAFFTGTGGVPLGSPFIGTNQNYACSTIDVPNVVTNIIRLNITSSYSSQYVGANEIKIIAKHADPPTTTVWEQPVWTSNLNNDGKITASSNTSGRLPYGAFDGYIGYTPAPGYPAGQWTCNSKTGWIQLQLNYDIIVTRIYFYNRESSDGNRTKNAYFTGTGGVALGSPFVGVNQNYGLSVINVGNVRTNTIKLNVTSCYSSQYVGANEIVILGVRA